MKDETSSSQPEPFFEWYDLLVRYSPYDGSYLCMDNLLGKSIGEFEFAEGPGWTFYAFDGVIMSLYPLYQLHQELTAIFEGYYDD